MPAHSIEANPHTARHPAALYFVLLLTRPLRLHPFFLAAPKTVPQVPVAPTPEPSNPVGNSSSEAAQGRGSERAGCSGSRGARPERHVREDLRVSSSLSLLARKSNDPTDTEALAHPHTLRWAMRGAPKQADAGAQCYCIACQAGQASECFVKRCAVDEVTHTGNT